ncbi:MAG: hypothetical protein ACM3ZQ_11475 [Bacillota bacterium]
MRAHRLIWLPRALAIMFILFISLFSLDVFDGEAPLLLRLGGFVVHSLPSILMGLILAVAWKRSALGGWLFLLFDALFTLRFNLYQSVPTLLVLSLPITLIGILFIVLPRLGDK